MIIYLSPDAATNLKLKDLQVWAKFSVNSVNCHHVVIQDSEKKDLRFRPCEVRCVI